MKVLIYNHWDGRMETHWLEPSAPMPYIDGHTLTVREFRSNSASEIIWSDRRAMEAWNATRSAWGRPIHARYVFKRIGEGGHANQSQHYAGMAFDVAQNLDAQSREALRVLARRLAVWSYVEPASLAPTWVHFDARLAPPACLAGYPVVRHGSRSVYVCTLQDALTTIGYRLSSIDGIFGPATLAVVRQFQTDRGLPSDGIVGCATWQTLTAAANGVTRNATSMPPTYIYI